MSKCLFGFPIIIDTHAESGEALNDSALMDLAMINDEESDFQAVDHATQVVTLEYLEKRDALDIQRYSI